MRKLKLWESIDEMPVYNWFKINETNDLYHMLKEPFRDWKKHEEEIKEALRRVRNEYIDTFGIGDKFRRIVRIHGEIAAARCDMVLDKDMSKLTEIEILEYELKELTQEEPKKHLDEMSVQIEKYMGFRINKKEVTVKEYYTYLNSFVDDVNRRNGPLKTD